MNDRDALYRTIVERPDEDTPRLVFADWLQEHGDEARAEFIRVQCRLNTIDEAEPEFAELKIREWQLLACHAIGWRNEITLPQGFSHSGHPHPWPRQDTFRRGFLDWVTIRSSADPSEFPRLMRETNIRRVEMTGHAPGSWHRSLFEGSPLRRADGLRLSFSFGSYGHGSQVRVAAESDLAPELRVLRLASGSSTEAELTALAGADQFTSLTELSIEFVSGLTAAQHQQFVTSSVLNGLSDLSVERGLLALDTFMDVPPPHLRSLSCQFRTNHPSEGLPICRGMLPELRALDYWVYRVDPRTLFSALGWGSRPLASLGLREAISEEHTRDLVEYLSQTELHTLHFDGRRLGSDALGMVTRCPHLIGLRRFGISHSGKPTEWLKALTTAEWPALQWLSMPNPRGRGSVDEYGMNQVLKALKLNNLRHLNLEGLPVGTVGARTLASQGALANLRSLKLRQCNLNGNALDAILSSPVLHELEYLDLRANPFGVRVRRLLDPAVMPNLVRCRIEMHEYDANLRDALLETGRVTT